MSGAVPEPCSGAARGHIPMPHEPNAHDVLVDAHAFWLRAPGHGEIRPVTLPEPGRGDVVVRTLRSGVSRGTETLVFRGGVPPGQYAAMRAPFQEGEFPGPVKYGYLNVGAVEEGPPELRGRTVFCLYPHQTVYVVPSGAVTVVPDDVPPARAVLAGTVETAVNALWDAPALVGDRVAVVGAGMVGCCVARLLARFPAVEVTLVDVDASRAEVATALGARFARPEDAVGGCDLVVHTSATSAGLQRSIDLLAPEGTVLELSWYGDAEVRLSLGDAFHAGRPSPLEELNVQYADYAVWERHWRVGDVLMWNNLSVLHRRDPFDPKTRRVMHRSQIKGNERIT